MDTIGDFLTRVRNALKARHKYVDVPASNLKIAMAEIMREQGYVDSIERIEDTKQGMLRVTLKYTNGQPAIMGLKRISTPGLRKYTKATETPRVLSGLGIAILSTPKGLMTDKQARQANVGGEILCYVW
ncbi:MAG: 30S ribosomal protein S8 [Bacteroidota bacterium]|nr:30S ribosomal protein S8 [Bacteroidota bacterium]MDP4234716.1 30S ribosomal protein S8 [Bacteroidota bacterium]MDP4243939.1 30S ribosomal protein S8 [Bacteroidota bacterium]MDP4288838.1 30S ribosomal protein S8 [Bacteroidota bacterium]